jgi:2-methylcitrate dehydratase PrpD
VRLEDGRIIERHVAYAKGAPENPLSDDELYRKVVSLVEPVLGRARCEALFSCVAALEGLSDFRELLRLLAAPGAA